MSKVADGWHPRASAASNGSVLLLLGEAAVGKLRGHQPVPRRLPSRPRGRSEHLADEGLQLCETHGHNLLASEWIGKAADAATGDTARTPTDTMERWAARCRPEGVQLGMRLVRAAVGRGT